MYILHHTSKLLVKGNSRAKKRKIARKITFNRRVKLIVIHLFIYFDTM